MSAIPGKWHRLPIIILCDKCIHIGTHNPLSKEKELAIYFVQDKLTIPKNLQCKFCAQNKKQSLPLSEVL